MESTTNKSSKELKDERQKDAKLEEQLLKSLSSVPTNEEKFSLLIKRFIELDKENKRLNTTIKQHEKRHELILREKDILQKEHNKDILMRNKLEQVCREQQKLIKSVKNESMSKIREEEEKRKENQAKFQHSINEINVTLNKNNDENIKLKEDNIEMTKKLKYLAEQYQVREKQLDKINEQIHLESQLHEAKLAKIQMEGTIEKEILLREKQGALDELLSCKKAIQEMQNREELLKEQLNLYTAKYDDFQSSLQKSNNIFSTYKTELEKMTKKNKKLEKESIDWRRKCEKSNANLLDLAAEKQVRDEYIAKSAKQMHQLQKLLRTLQAERISLHQILKDNNIERPSMPILPPEPEPITISPPKPQTDRMEMMAKNCAELKQTLAKLQGQMNALTSIPANENPPPTEEVETKKPKNKKSKNKNKIAPAKDVSSTAPAAVTSSNKDEMDSKDIESTEKNEENDSTTPEVISSTTDCEKIENEIISPPNTLSQESVIDDDTKDLSLEEIVVSTETPITNTDVVAVI